MGDERNARRVRVERGIYRQPSGNYAVCTRYAGRLHFLTVGSDLDAARQARVELVDGVRWGEVPASPRLRFGAVAACWLERFEARVAAGERRPRTLEAHRYQLERHLLPALATRRISALAVEDVAALLHLLREKGCSAKTAANSLATLQSIMRFARRNGWVVADPVERLEHHERPQPPRRHQRVLGRKDIARLLAECSGRDRLMIATALYTGLRISELLGLIWDDIDFASGLVHLRAQLSRARRGEPARRVPPKTPASVRDIPLVVQLSRLLAAHKLTTPFAAPTDWVFATSNGTPFGHRNVARRCLTRAAERAGLNEDGWPPIRFHDLRHVFASHLIVDLGLDVAQVSRILGHASSTITLSVYTHLFDDARHTREIRERMSHSPFVVLLERGNPAAGSTTPDTARARRLPANRRARRRASRRRQAKSGIRPSPVMRRRGRS